MPVFNMNPASYENVDNVDWAALAQQWIHMQDIPAAPPPPMFTTPGLVTNTSRPIYEEKGVADMEVDSQQDPIPHYETSTNNSPWATSPFNQPPPMPSQPPLNQQWTGNNQPTQRARPFGGHHNQNSRKGYMTSGTNERQATGPSHNEIWAIPPQALNVSAPPPIFNVSSLQAKGNGGGTSSNAAPASSSVRSGREYHKTRESAAPPSLALLEEGSEVTETSSLDAAKRKNLPAWIR